MTTDPSESFEPGTRRASPASRWLPAAAPVVLTALLLVAPAFAALPGAAAPASTDGTTSDAVITEPDRATDARTGAGTSTGTTPGAGAAENGPERRCETPEEISPAQEPLPGLSGALGERGQRGQPLTIVVLGSLSSGAKGHAPGADGFPARLQARLYSEFAARGVAVPVKVEIVGRTRALAGELATLIERQVMPLKPALVLWLVGRADARKGNPPYRFSKSLGEGLDTLQRQGIDTVLADIQFHPQFEALYRTDDYRNYVRWVTGKRDLPLLRRYEMIEYWAMSGLIDLDSGNDADQKAAYEFIQTCLAYQAARMIVGGAGLVR